MHSTLKDPEWFDVLQEQIDRRFNELKEHMHIEFRERDKYHEASLKAVTDRTTSLDSALRDHVLQQIEQVRVAATAADRLQAACIESVRREIILSNESSEKAIAKAEASTEKRFEAVNEFREQLREQGAGFMTRSETVTITDANAEKVEQLRVGLTELSGRVTQREGQNRGMSQLWAFIVGGTGMVVAFITIFAWINSFAGRIDRNSELRYQVKPVIQTQPAIEVKPAAESETKP